MDTKIEQFYEFEGVYNKWIDLSEKYTDLQEAIVMLLNELDKSLTKEQKEKLATLRLLYYRKEEVAKRATYKGGFKTGLGLAIEAVADEYKGDPRELEQISVRNSQK